MENKIELLKKLGFSDDYLKYITVEPNKNAQKEMSNFLFDTISVDSPEIIYPVIEKSDNPINNYFN